MISFQSTNPSFLTVYPSRIHLKRWLKEIIRLENYSLESLSFMLMTDDELLAYNRSYLGHDTYTDIITFSLAEDHKTIYGDICISIDRMIDNALRFKIEKRAELLRLMAHGVLHLCGHKDHSDAERASMRALEEKYLNLWSIVPRGTL